MNLDRYVGAMLGLGIGDALGAGYEFKVPPFPVSDEYETGVFDTAPGHPTDDTQLAIILGESIVNCRGFDINDWVPRLKDWLDSGPPDVGGQTARAITTLAKGRRPHSHTGAGGNGALMAILPLVLAYADHDSADAIDTARTVAGLTHPHPSSLDACASFAAVVAPMVRLGLDDWPGEVPPLPSADPAGTFMGWSTLTYGIAAQAVGFSEDMDAGRALSTLQSVIHLGGDTDTNAAVTGALLGARFGNVWPDRLVDGLATAPQLYRLALDLHELAQTEPLDPVL